MVIGIVGENCSGKSTLAAAVRAALGGEIVTGKDYLRMVKGEAEARALFRQKLMDAVSGSHVIYVISEAEQLTLLPDGAVRILVCGFLSGRAELLCWEPSDLFQFCHDTTPILGSLDTILAKVDADAVDRAVRTGACNLYHGCVHNLLFERDEKALPGLYKAATFVIRALVFRQTGRFCRRLDELSAQAGEEEKKIIAAYVRMTHGGAGDFQGLSESLFGWAQRIITLPTDVRNTF